VLINGAFKVAQLERHTISPCKNRGTVKPGVFPWHKDACDILSSLCVAYQQHIRLVDTGEQATKYKSMATLIPIEKPIDKQISMA
jgi:hypothetical protein